MGHLFRAAAVIYKHDNELFGIVKICQADLQKQFI